MASVDTLIDNRYRLVNCIGAGGMGEVWKAQDVRFEQKFVAIKLLKEDETYEQDSRNRQRLAQQVFAEAGGSPIPADVAMSLLDDVLRSGKGRADLNARVTAKVDESGAIAVAGVLALFDALVHDTGCSENARMRARLRKLFRDEANSVVNLDHENVVRVSDYGEFDGAPFLTMDYVEGQTLHTYIQRGTVDRPREILWMEQLCAGLGYAHGKRLVHQDIKPANLIIEKASDRLKVLDFGVVRRMKDTPESTMSLPAGTLCYMSPEQIRGRRIDHRSDIFAVGAVLYELLTKMRAFPLGDSVADVISRIQTEMPAPARELAIDITPRLEAILDRALQKDPAARFQDLAEMRRELDRAREELEKTVPFIKDLVGDDGPVPATVRIKEVPATVTGPTPAPAPVAIPTPEPAFAPTVAPTPVSTPLAVPEPPRPRRTMVIGAVALIAVVLGLGTWGAYWYSTRDTGQDPVIVQPPPVAASAVVTFDLRPWARLTVTPLDKQTVPTGDFVTPVVISLAPGRYRIDGENGNLTDKYSEEITVVAGKPMTVSKDMPGFSAEALVTRLLGSR